MVCVDGEVREATDEEVARHANDQEPVTVDYEQAELERLRAQLRKLGVAVPDEPPK
jgi:hypothetical protein